MKQCTVLFVNPDLQQSAHPHAMRGMGFLVDEVTEWPDDNEMVRNYHVVIVRVRAMNGAPMLAARLRAKPHFGRRLLIALVTADTSQADRRAAEASGSHAGRTLASAGSFWCGFRLQPEGCGCSPNPRAANPRAATTELMPYVMRSS